MRTLTLAFGSTVNSIGEGTGGTCLELRRSHRLIFISSRRTSLNIAIPQALQPCDAHDVKHNYSSYLILDGHNSGQVLIKSYHNPHRHAAVTFVSDLSQRITTRPLRHVAVVMSCYAGGVYERMSCINIQNNTSRLPTTAAKLGKTRLNVTVIIIFAEWGGTQRIFASEGVTVQFQQGNI